MKKLLRAAVIGVVWVLVLPSGLVARLLHRLGGSGLLFEFFAQAYAQAPGRPGLLLRSCYYHQTLRRCHLDGEFCFGSLVTKIDADLGRGVCVGLYSSVGNARVGEGTVIANYVSVLSGRRQHNFDDPQQPLFSGRDVFSQVVIGEHSFIGERAVVMANVGAHTIVGAGAVVVRDIPDYVVAVGSPARPARERPRGAAARGEARAEPGRG